MAEGTKQSGLNDMIGAQLEKLDALPNIAILFIILILISILTQIASNAATASMLLPIIRDLAIKLEVLLDLYHFLSTIIAVYVTISDLGLFQQVLIDFKSFEWFLDVISSLGVTQFGCSFISSYRRLSSFYIFYV